MRLLHDRNNADCQLRRCLLFWQSLVTRRPAKLQGGSHQGPQTEVSSCYTRL